MPSRYEREIEDILEKAGVAPERGGSASGSDARAPKKRRSRSIRRLTWLYVKQSLSGGAWSFSPGRIMLIGVVLLLISLPMTWFASGVPLLAFLPWVGLLLAIIGYGMALARPAKREKRWRGQLIEESESRSRIKTAFYRIRRKLSG